jgi:hypothetical protein
MKRMILLVFAIMSLGAGTAMGQSLAHPAPPRSQNQPSNGD